MSVATSGESLAFVVCGKGRFPFDMLRICRCFPLGPDDSAALEESEQPRLAVLRMVVDSPVDSTRWADYVCEGRWQSFGWNVMPEWSGGKPLVQKTSLGLRVIGEEWFGRLYPKAGA